VDIQSSATAPLPPRIEARPAHPDPFLTAIRELHRRVCQLAKPGREKLCVRPCQALRPAALRHASHGRWHLDEMCIRIGGKQMYLWRAVDAEGEILDVLLQAKRDTKATRKLMRKLLKKQGVAPDE
jgi:DDE domain